MQRTHRVSDYYSPSLVATLVTESVQQTSPDSIIDSSSGDGALLVAAARRFAEAKILAIDSNGGAVRRLKKKLPNAIASTGDSLAMPSLRRTSVFRCTQQVDLVLANPPFSGDKGNVTEIEAWGKSFKCGYAAAHILNVLASFSPKELVGVFPESFFSCTARSTSVEFHKKSLSRPNTKKVREQILQTIECVGLCSADVEAVATVLSGSSKSRTTEASRVSTGELKDCSRKFTHA